MATNSSKLIFLTIDKNAIVFSIIAYRMNLNGYKTDNFDQIRLVPAQDIHFTLILQYIAKIIPTF